MSRDQIPSPALLTHRLCEGEREESSLLPSDTRSHFCLPTASTAAYEVRTQKKMVVVISMNMHFVYLWWSPVLHQVCAYLVLWNVYPRCRQPTFLMKPKLLNARDFHGQWFLETNIVCEINE